jgi:transcriptional regulator with XRE-family HTH domain
MIIPVFEELKTLLRTSGYPTAYVSNRTGVARETLSRWLRDITFTPRIDTMLRVARFLANHDIVLTERAKKMVGFYPAPKERMTRHDVRVALMRGTNGRWKTYERNPA